MTHDEVLAGLNEEQKEAARTVRQPVLVMAPMGTGKTKVITHRAAYAILEGTDPSAVLCLSFTNKAAREMRERLAQFLGKQAGEITTRTFHGLCASILRQEAEALGIDPDFVIFDEEDCRTLMGQLWRRHRIQVGQEDYERFEFLLFQCAEKARLARFDGAPAETPDEIFHKILRDAYLKATERRQPFPIREILAEYHTQLRDQHALDFADLIVGVILLWQQHPERLRWWQQRYRWVQVDEVQDTSRAEYLVLASIAAGHRNLSFFGDIDQTIYEWRGSAPFAILEEYRRDFQPIKEISLVRNYRSTKRILNACRMLLKDYPAAVTERMEAQLAEEGEAVAVHHAANPSAETEWIARRIKQLRTGAGLRYRDCAILARTNFTARRISGQLEKLEVPHMAVDQVKFFSRAEIKDALAPLRLLLNPHDGNSLARFLARPPKGIGQATIDELRSLPRELALKWTDLAGQRALAGWEPFHPLRQCLDEGRVVVFDVETTGLDTARDEIVELAAARCGREGVIERFGALLRPSGPVGDSFNIHRISDEQLEREGRDPRQALEEFQRFAAGCALAGHNASFDIAITSSQMARLGLGALDIAEVYDTLEISRRLLRLSRYTLASVCEHLCLPVEPTHRAAADVEATAALLLALRGRLDERADERAAVITRHAARFRDVAVKLARWRERLEFERPHELLARVLEESGLAEHYEKQQGGERRVEHLKELLRLFELYDGEEPRPEDSLRNLLASAALGSDTDRQLGDEDRVALLTVHQAKGLEFDTVFIAGATDDEFPNMRSKREGRLEEEHRLFYVAMSRARRRLHISYPERNDWGRPQLASRYLRHLGTAGDH